VRSIKIAGAILVLPCYDLSMGIANAKRGRAATKRKPIVKQKPTTRQTLKKSWSIDRLNMKRLSEYVRKNKIKSESAVVSQAIGHFLDEEAAREEREQAAREFLETYQPEEHATPDEKRALLDKWLD